MELGREPDPQSSPAATGAVGEAKKLRIISGVAIGFGLLMAMLLLWAWSALRRPTPQQRVGPVPTAKKATTTQPNLDEDKEKAYEDGRRAGARSNPAFNPSSDLGAEAGSVNTGAVAPEKKRTPKDDYDDLLAKAALADSTVEGGKGLSGAAATALSDMRQNLPTLPTLPQSGAQPSPDERKPDSKLQPIGKNVLPAGTFIDCNLVNGLNGDNLGPVKFQVSNDVYYPSTLDLAIPQGAVFLGEAQKVSAQFQQRLAVTFDRLQLTRDGKLYEVKLDRIPGLDQQGAAALKDKVNNHYLQIFGASLAIGAVGGLAQIGNGSYGGLNGIDSGTQIRNGISQTMAENASQVLNRFLTRLPTVTINPGKPAIIYLPFGVDLS